MSKLARYPLLRCVYRRLHRDRAGHAPRDARRRVPDLNFLLSAASLPHDQGVDRDNEVQSSHRARSRIRTVATSSMLNRYRPSIQ